MAAMKRMTLKRLVRGMSLVEMMVAIVISLLGTLVIFQVFAVNEGTRRSTTATGDEQTSGLLALLQLERELRTAGYGINDFDVLGCQMKMYDNQRTPSAVPQFPLTAVQIVSNAGTTPDLIRVIYGQPTDTSVSFSLSPGMASVTDTVTLTRRFGWNTGDKFIIGQPSQICTMGEVTSLAGLVDLAHVNGSYVNSITGTSQTSRFNDPAGFPMAYGYLVGKVMNLGQFPVRNEITVDVGDADPNKNNTLTVQNLWDQLPSPQPIAEQIVALKAQYGMDDGINNGTITGHAAYVADDNLVDNYVDGNAATSPNALNTQVAWSRIRAVRVAVVSRSLTGYHPNSGTACDATPAYGSAGYMVRWGYGPSTPTGQLIDVRIGTDWQCYKYRVYETVVPLRNVYWRQP
jgi:type IV pilus assembly protein PilW